jgi:hypothetical protein
MAGQLISPPLAMLATMDLPKQSILHYTTNSLVEVGPLSDDFIFRNITRPIMVGHITENGDNKGNPRRLSIAPDTLIRSYHIKHRKFRLMRNVEAAAKDINTLIVYNYGLIPKMYKYMRTFYTAYYKWWNINAAVCKEMAELSTSVNRNQFMICNLPMILPSVSDLRMGSKPITQKTAKIFNNAESLMILELWKWFGEERSESLFGKIPEENLDKINIIFQESGRWFVMNLGRMNKWRIATKVELELNPKANIKGIQAKQLQLRFLRLMMALFQTRTLPVEEVVKINPKDNPNKDLQPVVVKQDATSPTIDPETGIISKKTEVTIAPEEVEHNDILSAEVDESITHSDELHAQLEKDLSELETISKQHFGDMDDEGVVNKTPYIEESITLEGGVMRICDRLADSGLLSAGEYRKFDELSKSYRSIKAPNGIETLDKFITIDPKTLVIESSHQFKDISTVPDKTMLKSSLKDFDKRYIKHVMQKDVASMVMNVQNAGMAVTGYEVERVENVLGSYDSYTVKIKPVDGAPSILRYKLPAVEDDGTFVSNGIKYTMRKQRGDLPIRKISPDVVALTSYYGKVFVSRSGKKSNDYGQWLRNSVMAKGLDDADNTITKLYPTNVFDSEFTSPRPYSSLSQGFRAFTVTKDKVNYDLSFDRTKAEELYGKEAISTYERDGSVIFGISNNTLLVMDKEDSVYSTNNGELVDLCTIEELLSLEPARAPIDHAELKVMGRDIPIGIILGYELGLDKLMTMLGVNPRRVGAGTRVSLEDHEYSIVFDDETLVFSRDDKAASIILSGFNEYHKTIRNYGVYDFDKPGVYLNILESGGASTKYLREIDLMYQMFIDPITKDLLLEMKEPTTFHGLIIRSCELLLTDQHPDELDPAQMRIKGYERMSGIVYNELVRSIRGHNGKPGKGSKQVDLNPYAVWMTLRQDPTVTIVNEINPVQNLKETEAVTYSGMGGRNSRSMTKHTRIYHKNDMGTISESTVDSSDVAINVFTSADPQFTSLRGMTKRYVVGETGATALLSTSALMAPCSDMDD